MDVRNIEIRPGHLWSAGILFPIVCSSLVIARYATRRAHTGLGWDDWLALPALLGVCGLSAAVLYGVATKALGYSDPSYDGDYLHYQSRNFTVNRQIYWAALVIQAPTLGFIKLSCLTFYLRVFRTGIRKVPEVILWALITIIVIWGISFTVASLFFCGTLTHLNWLWGSAGDYLKCKTNTYVLQQSYAISDVITDALLVIFPLPYVCRLHISTARKLALGFVFMLGSASLAMSTVRMVCQLQGVEVTKYLARGGTDYQPGYILTTTTYIMLLEVGFGLCAVCLPALSSALRLPGVQTFFRNVSQIYSIRSNSSVTASIGRSEKVHEDKSGVYREKDFGVTYSQA